MKLENLLKNKDSKERASLKQKEIAKVAFRGKYKKDKLEIEIIDIKKIEGGVSVFVKVWKEKKQLSFGPDGSVEIERFNIYNPPILVPDENGKIIRIDKGDKFLGVETKIFKYREDPKEALLQVIESNILSMKNVHSDKSFEKGKVGQTTSTFYPAAGANSPVDGYIRGQNSSDLGWNAVHDLTDNGPSGLVDVTATTINGALIYYFSSNGSVQIHRGFILFDTAALGTDTIDSATVTVNVTTATTQGGGGGANHKFCVFQSNPASNNNLVSEDFDQVGSIDSPTKGSDELTIATGTQVFTLNATGRGWIDGAGITKLGTRNKWDYDDVSFPNYSKSYAIYNSADAAGTTQDPKLVVEHSAPAATFVASMQII